MIPPQPVPLQHMTVEALTPAMTSKVRSETQTLVGDENMNSFCSTRARVEAHDGQSSAAMESVAIIIYLHFGVYCNESG